MAVVKLGVDGVTFKELWANYPWPDYDYLKEMCFRTWEDGDPTKSKEYFNNYCAIRMSECLIASGFKFKVNGHGKRCHSHRSDPANKNRHFLLAEEMAHWLFRIPIPGMGPTEKLNDPSDPKKDPNEFKKLLKGRTGMIFYKDYWQRTYRSTTESFANRSGDHIDLWDGSASKSSEGVNCQQVWFWEVL